MESVSLSLDDIIKKKKIRQRKKPKTNFIKSNIRAANGKTTIKKHGGSFQKPMIDARNKIIEKHRSQIFDARDKLVQIAKRNGDVRRKLLKKGLEKPSFKNRRSFLEQPVSRPTKLVRRPYKTPSYIEHDIRMDIDANYIPALRRTVKNDVSYASRMPPLPTFKHIEDPRQQIVDNWSAGGPDPFDCYEVPISRPYDVSEPRNLNRQQVIGHQVVSQKPILRASPDSRYRYSDMTLPQRSFEQDRYRNTSSHLSYEMRSRLHHSPDLTQSMGIFSNPYNARSDEIKQKSGYRIVVSNLHSSVSQNDVKELFEDIGPLVEARLVKPGVAEVIFAEMKDAEAAVDSYHNRQLDGQPMKCLLVNPRPSGKPTAPAIRTSRSSSSKLSKVEIDIDALHTVLFRRN